MDLLELRDVELTKGGPEEPEKVKNAPISTSVRLLDEYRSAHPKTMALSYRMYKEREKEGVL